MRRMMQEGGKILLKWENTLNTYLENRIITETIYEESEYNIVKIAPLHENLFNPSNQLLFFSFEFFFDNDI